MSDAAHTLTDAERVRIDQIDGLVLRGADGVGALIDALSDRSWTVRRAAVAGLASLGDDAVRPLCDWLSLRRTSEHAISAAVDALSLSVGATATTEVIALASRTGAAVDDAVRVLGRRRAFEGVPLLRALLADASDNVALSAIEALGAIGGTASIHALVEVIESRNFFRTYPAMQVAARTGDPRVIEPLAMLLGDELYQFEAARALGRTGSVLAIAPLERLLAQPASSGPEGNAIARLVASSLDELWTRAAWSGAGDQVLATIQERFAPLVERFVPIAQRGELAERRSAIRLLGAIGNADILPALLPILVEPELHAVTVEAVQRLARTDDASLAAALARPDPAIRAAVLPVVTSQRSVVSVRRMLGDEDAEVRARACEALARLGDTRSLRALFHALEDASPRVTHAAAAAIHSLGSKETTALAIATIRKAHPSARRQALRVIAYLGNADAFDAVVAATADPDLRTSALAVTALAALDDPRVDDVIVELARSPQAKLRSAVMRAAGRRATARMIAVLDRGIEDDDAWVRYYACQALGLIGGAATTTKLLQRLADASAQVRVAAIEALARLDTPETWQQLMSLARSRDPDEQRAALVGIAQHTRPAAIALLVDAARSPDLATRLIALAGLGRSTDAAALSQLASAARDPIPEIRDAALSLLGERMDAGAAAVLVDAAVASDAEHPVHFTLSRPGAARIAAIRRRLATAREGAVTLLVAALARMHDAEATSALFEMLGDSNPDVRRDAISALVTIDARGAVEAARRLAEADPDREVRRASAATLVR